MNALNRKKVAVISRYATETFTEADWLTLGQITASLDTVTKHGRLLRALSFADDDYGLAAIEVLNAIFEQNENLIDDVVEHFDISLWYHQKYPEKHQRLFLDSIVHTPDFWRPGCVKAFVSHLSAENKRTAALKWFLETWGLSAFIAHEDIQPSREWRNEVEAALETMDVMIAIVQPGFKESDWCSQEVGYALGRKVEIVPVRAGLDPFGFFGKYQAIPAKGRPPSEVAREIVLTLLKKPKHRDALVQGFSKSFALLPSDVKVENFEHLDSWHVITDEQMKALLESSNISKDEAARLYALADRVKAFATVPAVESLDEDVPF